MLIMKISWSVTKMNKYGKRILLVETFPFRLGSSQMLEESIQYKDGILCLTGRMQYANRKNGNDRIYPRAILEREVNKYAEKIRTNTSYGQCDHPDSDQISLRNAALLVRDLKWVGDQLIGTIQILSNRVGQDLKNIVLKNKGALSISSRGLGSLRRTDKGDEVQDDFELIGWDLVVQPSTPGATFWNDGKINAPIQQKVQKLIQNKPKVMGEKEKLQYLSQQIKKTIERNK